MESHRKDGRYSHVLLDDHVKMTVYTQNKIYYELLLDIETYQLINEKKAELYIKKYTTSPFRLRVHCVVDGNYYNLSRWILNVDDISKRVLFKNQNELDFRSHNLVEAETKHASQNRRGPQKNNKSKIRGVYFDKHKKKWYGQFHVNYKRYTTPYCDDKEQVEREIKEKRSSLQAFSFGDQ